MKNVIFVLFLFSISLAIPAKNPIIPNVGANDPHIRIIDGIAYLSASHDKSVDNESFIMEDWWLWSSTDLVDWKLEYVLKPEETYIGKPYQGCWATDIVKRNGKFYWYFSERNHQSGVMVAEDPGGPWRDPLGKPLLAEDLTPTHEYDMGIFQDQDGDYYIVFGVWDYYIARLNEDMISLAESPRKIEISDPRGPYNPDGKNTERPTDDKPFIHMYKDKYYLSWGCFYAMGDNVYGPYTYKGSIIEKESFAPGYDSPTWPHGFKQGRHGSFFEWHNQWYFAYCDISQTGNRYFRDTFISYVHYKSNGEMALIHVDGIGVGEYDAHQIIQAENYFASSGVEKIESAEGGFYIGGIDNSDYLIFNQIHGLSLFGKIEINVCSAKNARIEIRRDHPHGQMLACSDLIEHAHYQTIRLKLPPLNESENICLVVRGEGKNLIKLDSFIFN